MICVLILGDRAVCARGRRAYTTSKVICATPGACEPEVGEWTGSIDLQGHQIMRTDEEFG